MNYEGVFILCITPCFLCYCWLRHDEYMYWCCCLFPQVAELDDDPRSVDTDALINPISKPLSHLHIHAFPHSLWHKYIIFILTKGSFHFVFYNYTREPRHYRSTTLLVVSCPARGSGQASPHGSPQASHLLSMLLESEMLKRRVEESCTQWRSGCSDSEHHECRGHHFGGL